MTYKPPISDEQKEEILKQAEEYLPAHIHLISACQDEQITNDCSNVNKKIGLGESKRDLNVNGADGGACTSVLLKILYNYAQFKEDNGIPTYGKLLSQLRGILKNRGYEQLPQLTGSRPIQMTDEFQVVPRNFSGTRRALIIGITYKGKQWELPGCHNDCFNMIKYLKTHHGFKDEDITLLLDDNEHCPPNRQNLATALHRFAFSLKPGDAAFFHFSGHGVTQTNGEHQALVPLDYPQGGDLVDNEIFRLLLLPLPRGLHLTAIVDCCHSGSIFDLPFSFVCDDNGSKKETDLREVEFPHMRYVKMERRRIRTVASVESDPSEIEKVLCVEATSHVEETEAGRQHVPQ